MQEQKLAFADVSELECRRFWRTGCLSGATGGETEQTEFSKLSKKLSEEIGSADSLISSKATFFRKSGLDFSRLFSGLISSL